MRTGLPSLLVCLLASLSLGQATQPGAIHLEPELRDALNGLDKHISPTARTNPKAANERERKLGRLMTILLMSERPDQAETGKKNAANIEAADGAIKDQFSKMRADPANAAQPIQEQLAVLEKLALESIHLLDFLSRPTTFPTTRASQLDLAKRLEQIPAMLDREDQLNRDVTHHEKRLTLLKQIDSLQKSGENPEKLAAVKELVAALDQLAAAQAKLDRLTPAGTPATQPVQ
jgi:hypothetical protein